MARSDAATPDAYLAELEAGRAAELGRVRNAVNAAMPGGYVERMAWGMISWEVPMEVSGPTYNKQPLVYAALAAQKPTRIATSTRPSVVPTCVETRVMTTGARIQMISCSAASKENSGDSRRSRVRSLIERKRGALHGLWAEPMIFSFTPTTASFVASTLRSTTLDGVTFSTRTSRS